MWDYIHTHSALQCHGRREGAEWVLYLSSIYPEPELRKRNDGTGARLASQLPKVWAEAVHREGGCCMLVVRQLVDDMKTKHE